MDTKERDRLNGGIVTRNAEQRQNEHREETENENGNCDGEVRRGRSGGSAKQQQCNTEQCDKDARDPEFPHD